MPKFIVTSGSYFRPYTYDELARPVVESAEMQRSAQDAYDTINLETEALRQYIEQEPEDSRARQMYNNYTSQLSSLQNNLWNNGYNAGTRRDLAKARSGYASDVSRLATAIKNRQERSKEYWDIKHKNPDMVMGEDPGLSGLDNYLANDRYGSDYYSYSGNAFANEVGADAKARANELLRNPEYSKNPAVAGYITRILQEGFTSQEVQKAGDIAKQVATTGNRNLLNNLPIAEGILANVLLSHLDATGARGKVSDVEFDRLFEYGRSGLSQAIGKTTMHELSDKQWDYNKQIALANYRAGLGSGRGNTTRTTSGMTSARPYTLNDISTFLKSQGANEALSSINKHFKKPFEEPIILSDGDVIASPLDANRILNSFGREDIMAAFGGIDPEHPLQGTGEMLAGNGERTKVRVVENEPNDFDNSFVTTPYLVQTQNEKGRWINDAALTEQFNRMNKDYQSRLTSWKEANPDINLNRLAITEKERQKMYKENNIPDDVPVEYAPYILAAKSNIGRATPATIASATVDMDQTRKNYARQIAASYNRALSAQGKIAKNDESAFYPINNGVISERGTSITDVFGKKGEETLNEIYVYPEDLVNNRIRIGVGGKQFAINPAMLGNNMDSQIQKMRSPVLSAMRPILHPESVFQMSEDEAAQWILTTSNILGDYMPLVGDDGNGNMVVITPQDIVMNPELQTELRTAVTRLMNNVIADARDEMNLNNMQVRGNTASGANGYNDYLGEE